MISKKELFSALLTFSLTACGGDVGTTLPPDEVDPPKPVPGDNVSAAELKSALMARLREVSPTGSEDFFLIPDNDDYSRLPQDPNNPLSAEKVALGKFLFHDARMMQNPLLPSGRGKASCATCHVAELAFGSGRLQGIAEGGLGYGSDRRPSSQIPKWILDAQPTEEAQYPVSLLDVQPIRAIPTINLGYQEAALWNGSLGGVGVNEGLMAPTDSGMAFNANGFEGIETQALAGQGLHRLGLGVVETVPEYRDLFREAFNPSPSEPSHRLVTRERAALAIAAYERTLVTNRAPFQRELKEQEVILSSKQLKGALLFFGKAACYTCHSGPALNSMKFEAMGMAEMSDANPFEILVSNPAGLNDVRRGRGAATGDFRDDFKFKVPQLYNLKVMSGYGHGSSFKTVRSVVDYFNNAIPQFFNGNISRSFRPLGLSSSEVDELTSFLEEGLFDPDMERYKPTTLPGIVTSGKQPCIPNNDFITASQRNCALHP